MPPKRRQGFRVDGTFDIECAFWSQMVTGALYAPMDGVTIVRSPDALADELLRRGGTWWTHFGGAYDMLQVLDVLHRREHAITVHQSGSRVTRMVCGHLTVCDLYALVPMSLDAAGGFIGEGELPGLGWGCDCEMASLVPGGCEGLCKIEPTMEPARHRQLDEYCARDARRTYDVLAALARYASAHGIELRGTLGGTAWATAKAQMALPNAEWPKGAWRRIKRAEGTGRVTVTRPRAGAGVCYDIVNAYPAALARTPMPVGEMFEVAGSTAARAYRADRAGIYRATVEVPEDAWLPPLPWRAEGRVAYPTGQLTGSWTRLELNAAEARGTRVLQVHSATVWPDGERVLFDELVDHWFALRTAAGKDSALGDWLSKMAKALTGKLGQGPVREMVLFRPRRVLACDPDLPRCRSKGCTRFRCTRRCGSYRQLDNWGLVWSVRTNRAAESSHVHWASYLKSANRVAWLAEAERCAEGLLYGDTDSIWTVEGAPDDVGAGIGQWEPKRLTKNDDGKTYRPEPGFAEWDCLAPKTYRYRDLAGRWVCRAAGQAQMTGEQWDIVRGRPGALVSDRGVLSLREAVSDGRGLFRRRFRPRILPRSVGRFGDRLLSGDGWTYPVPRGQIEKIYRDAQSGRPGEATA